MTSETVVPAVPVQRNISNSEVIAWLSCRQLYYFAFFLNLAPKETPKALSRGTLGHSYMERYIEARLQGASHERSLQHADTVFADAMREGISIEVVMETKFLCERYMARTNGWPEWELLGTEERLDLRVTDTIILPIRYDLMVRDRTSGRVLVGDFKFTYDFWTPSDHNLNPQMPKYIAVMQANGIPVHGGFLEEIRTRKLGAEKAGDNKNTHRRTFYFPSNERRRSALKQHIAASFEIIDYWSVNDDEREAKTIPLLSKHGACKFCSFAELCNSKLDGKKDLSLDIATDFVDNTYGYNKTKTLEDLL